MKLRDIEYGAFSQLSYYNWFNYFGRQTKIYEIINIDENLSNILINKTEEFIEANTAMRKTLTLEGEKQEVNIYKESDKRILLMYSENTSRPDIHQKYKSLFKDWEFVEGSNHAKIVNETKASDGRHESYNYAGIGVNDSGFQACVFKKNNDLLIAYRGTDFADGVFSSGFAKDAISDIWIKLNEVDDQILCAVYFYTKMRLENKEKNVNITGHSLGGALAQFATLFGGDEIKSAVTWNGLGVDGIEDIESKKKSIVKSILMKTGGDTYDTKENEKKVLTNLLNEEKLLSNLDVENFDSLIKKDKELIRELELERYFPAQNHHNIIWQLRLIKKLEINYKKVDGILRNYYLDNDLIKSISNKPGKNICVDNPNQSSDKGTLLKVLSILPVGGSLAYHGIANFLPFFDDSGDIIPDKLSDNYMYNYLKTLLFHNLKIDITKENADTYKDEIIREILFNKNQKTLNNIIKTTESKNLLITEIREQLDIENLPYIIERDEIVFGKFANYNLLAGVSGMEEIRLNLIEILNSHPDGRKVDYIVKKLLDNEFKKNGLNFMINGDGIYNLYSSIVETMYTKDVTIFDIASKALNQNENKRIYLELAIEEALAGSDKRDSYVSIEKWEPSDKETVEELFKQASNSGTRFNYKGKQVKTPKSKRFYKSFLDKIEEEEKRKKISEDLSASSRVSYYEKSSFAKKYDDGGRPSMRYVGKNGKSGKWR